MAKQLVATETFKAPVNGFLDSFTAGETIVDEDHEVARQYPDRFKPVERARERPEVEDASAAPGHKRGETQQPTREKRGQFRKP